MEEQRKEREKRTSSRVRAEMSGLGCSAPFRDRRIVPGNNPLPNNLRRRRN